MPFNSLMVTLSEDTPVAVERTWDAAAFAELDARLAALGCVRSGPESSRGTI